MTANITCGRNMIPPAGRRGCWTYSLCRVVGAPASARPATDASRGVPVGGGPSTPGAPIASVAKDALSKRPIANAAWRYPDLTEHVLFTARDSFDDLCRRELPPSAVVLAHDPGTIFSHWSMLFWLSRWLRHRLDSSPTKYVGAL